MLMNKVVGAQNPKAMHEFIKRTVSIGDSPQWDKLIDPKPDNIIND
jgi:hypothetical protein